MAYSERYYHDYCSPQGAVCRVSFQEWNYEGPATEVEAAVYPFIKNMENSSLLKLGGVYPTTATVTFVSSDTFNMELLYTADESKFRIIHSVDGVVDWMGNVVPNGFYEDRHGVNRHMVITASDRLTLMQGRRFTDTDGTNYGVSDGVFNRSFIWAIAECLKKTGFLIPIWTMVDIKPATVDNSRTFAVDIAFNPSNNQITIRDYRRNVKNALAPGVSILVNSGTRVGQIFEVDSFTVTDTLAYDLIIITPVTPLTGDNEAYNASITIASQTPTASAPDPLAITFHDVRVWINEADEIGGQNYFQQRQTAKTVWEVLDAIARQWNVRIYLNGDHWEVVRWNVNKFADHTYQWFVYNSEGTLIGREPFGHTVDVPCHNTEERFEVFGSQMGMDRVLRGVNVNYRFKYKVEGDSLVNLIQNGNFEPGITVFPPPTLDPSQYTPMFWVRHNYATEWDGAGRPYMNIQFRAQGVTPGESYAPGIPYFAEFYGIPHRLVYLSSWTGVPNGVNASDILVFSWWQAAELVQASVGGPGAPTLPVWVTLRINLIPTGQNPNNATGFYRLVNATTEKLTGEEPVKWVEGDTGIFNLMSSHDLPAITTPVPGSMSSWVQKSFKAPPAPISGTVYIEIIGAAVPFANNMYSGIRTNPVAWYSPVAGGGPTVPGVRFMTDKRIRLTGMFVGKLIDPSNEAVPLIHGYTYPSPAVQRTRDYTDTIDDIEILTGDDNDEDHVSMITVGGQTIKQWDTWQNEYGWSALGLVLAKSVMEQYWVPWRIFEGTISYPGLTWNTCFTLEDRPGEKYAILRGSLNRETDTFSGTLVQIWEEGTPPLPPGGTDGGNTTEPQWTPTGDTRCALGDDGLNTGYLEQLETDTNPASNTYGQERWVSIGLAEDSCPVGQPIDLLWGEQLILDINTLRFYPYERNGDRYTVTYENDGGDRYLRFLHRASMGTVQRILYQGEYESIAAWVYEPDVTINGYVYKHLRLSWYVGVFSDLPVIFVIN